METAIHFALVLAGIALGMWLGIGLCWLLFPILDRLEGWPFGHPENGDYIDKLTEWWSK